MIRFEFHAEDVDKAMGAARDGLRRELPKGLELMLDAIASRARGDHGYVDRSGNLTASTQSAGIAGDIDAGLVGIVAFAAKSKSSPKYPTGYLYGLVQEHGTRDGRVKGKKFITNAVKAQDATPLTDAMKRAFRGAGFSVSG